jgi:hypothetical protein
MDHRRLAQIEEQLPIKKRFAKWLESLKDFESLEAYSRALAETARSERVMPLVGILGPLWPAKRGTKEYKVARLIALRFFIVLETNLAVSDLEEQIAHEVCAFVLRKDHIVLENKELSLLWLVPAPRILGTQRTIGEFSEKLFSRREILFRGERRTLSSLAESCQTLLVRMRRSAKGGAATQRALAKSLSNVENRMRKITSRHSDDARRKILRAAEQDVATMFVEKDLSWVVMNQLSYLGSWAPLL